MHLCLYQMQGDMFDQLCLLSYPAVQLRKLISRKLSLFRKHQPLNGYMSGHKNRCYQKTKKNNKIIFGGIVSILDISHTAPSFVSGVIATVVGLPGACKPETREMKR